MTTGPDISVEIETPPVENTLGDTGSDSPVVVVPVVPATDDGDSTTINDLIERVTRLEMELLQVTETAVDAEITADVALATAEQADEIAEEILEEPEPETASHEEPEPPDERPHKPHWVHRSFGGGHK